MKYLNFSPIQFDDREVKVGRLPYGKDGQQNLQQLRATHGRTHVFRRHGGESILAVPVSADAPSLGHQETIRLKEHLGLAAALVRNSLLNNVVVLGRKSRGYEPIEVVSNKDLLRNACPPGITPPDWLGVRILYELAVRPIYFVHKRPFVAAVLKIRTARLIERTAAELLSEGLSLVGAYVGRRVPSADGRIEPRFELLGCVRGVEGDLLRLVDCRDAAEIVKASEVWPVKDVFGDCLQLVFKDRAQEIYSALERQRAELRQGPAQLGRIKSMYEILQTRQYEMLPGAPFKFGALLDSASRDFPKLVKAPRPVYVFDQTGTKTAEWHDGGLNEYGPYTANVGSMRSPSICVICQKSYKAKVDQVLRTFFFNGVTISQSRPRTRAPKNYYKEGFCKKYRLSTVQYEYFLAEDNSGDAYHRACQEALEKHGNGHPWDLALIQIEESFQQLPPAANPYLISKLSFQSLQILVQEFTIETARKCGSSLSFCLNNMGLATYAKLGGIPWLLKSPSSDVHELVIGLGSAEVGEGRLGKRERFVGITTIFGGDGRYHVSNLSKAVSADQYRETLLKTLRVAISNVRAGMNWQRGDRVLLVFHAKFKDFSKEEVQAVSDLITEFADYDIKYAFVHISERHPFMAFDTAEPGVKDFETEAIKGEYAPPRGYYLKLGDRSALLFVTGASEVKRPEDGMPQPLLLELHPASTFTEITYLTEQAFWFACHSYRTFLPVSHPVTVQYPSLIADRLGKLSRLERWNPDVMLDRIGKTLWFL